MKRTSKRFLALLLVLTMAIGIMPFAALSVGAVEPAAGGSVVSETGKIKFVVGEDLIGAYDTANAACTVEVPDVAVDSMFGWYGVVISGSTTKKMLIKQDDTVTFKRGEYAVFKPLTLDIVQDPAPTLRIKNEEIAGLRFSSSVSKTGYQSLLDMIARGDLANASLSFGTLIGTFENVKDVPFTMAFNAGGAPVWYQETNDRGCIAGTVWASDIAALLENGAALSTAEIMAVGYAKLTVGGEDYYAYAKNDDKKAFTLFELAIEALNDVSAQMDASHKLQVGKDLYAPHTVSEREVLREFVEGVVSLRTLDNGDGIELIDYDYCNPNAAWTLDTVTENDADWATLLAQLGGDPDITLICKLQATDGAAAEGILLDSVLYAATEVEDAGNTYYLIGFVEFTSND